MMNPRVIAVKPLPCFKLQLTFANQEQKIFDVSSYLTLGIFAELSDPSLFNQVRAFNGSIIWPNELDLDPDTLYLDSQHQ